MNIADELRKLQELHRSGGLTDAEFAAAKAAVLAKGTADADSADEPARQGHLEEIKLQNKVAQLDREWELERERYMIAGRYGQRHIPNRGMSVIGGIMLTAFGILWIAMAASMTTGFGEVGHGPPGIFACFPLFGVLFILAGIGTSIYAYKKANEYEDAYRRYKQRRAQLLAEQSEREDSR